MHEFPLLCCASHGHGHGCGCGLASSSLVCMVIVDVNLLYNLLLK
jgi:NifU-like protein involved in Fe-S cluster formation